MIACSVTTQGVDGHLGTLWARGHLTQNFRGEGTGWMEVIF